MSSVKKKENKKTATTIQGVNHSLNTFLSATIVVGCSLNYNSKKFQLHYMQD